jgi:archaemetzincin
LKTPHDAFDPKREQYDSRSILRHLSRSRGNSLKVVGVTDVDLFVPVLKYVFGLAQVSDRCAVISIHRLRSQFYEAPPDNALLLERTMKTALHELGHSFGLTHCRVKRCVMFSSTRIADTDTKSDAFCPTCRDLFKWYRDKCLACDTP